MSQAENHSIVRRKSGCAKIYERRKLPKRSRHASDIVSFRNRASGKLQRAVRFRINGFRNRQKERNKKREKETKKGRKKERKTERKTEIRKEMKDSNSDRRREEKKNGNVCPLSGEYLLSANSKMAMMAPLSDEKIGDGESPHSFRNWRWSHFAIPERWEVTTLMCGRVVNRTLQTTFTTHCLQKLFPGTHSLSRRAKGKVAHRYHRNYAPLP